MITFTPDITPVFIDFEYQDTSDADYKIVAFGILESWGSSSMTAPLTAVSRCKIVMKDVLSEQIKVIEHVSKRLRRRPIFISWNVSAEARSFISLGLDPFKYEWIDLMVVWKIFRNGNPDFDVSRVKGSGEDSLLNAAVCLLKPEQLGPEVTKEYKDKSRDLILGLDLTEEISLEEGQEISRYCRSDVVLTRDIFEVLQREGLKMSLDNALEHGKYQVCMALCEHRGIDVDVDELTNRQCMVGAEHRQLQEELKKKCPTLFGALKKDNNLYSFKRKNLMVEIQRVIDETGMEWDRKKPTEIMKDNGIFEGNYTGDKKMLGYALSTGVKSRILETAFEYASKKNIYTFFTETGVTRSWYDYVGTDSKIRPYLKAFDSLTFRNYPTGKGFLLAQDESLHYMMTIPKGMYLINADIGQQEFAIAACMSGDPKMIEAYNSGDPYTALAKMSGNWDGRKETRDLYKVIVLSMAFGLGVSGLMWELRRFFKSASLSFAKAHDYYQTYWFTFDVYSYWREALWGGLQCGGTHYLGRWDEDKSRPRSQAFSLQHSHSGYGVGISAAVDC